MADMTRLREAIIAGDAVSAASEGGGLLDDGLDPVRIVGEGIGPAMAEVGRLFEECEYFVPELLMAARAAKAVFQLLRPVLAQTGAQPKGRVILGTVQGDLHDIGKNLVAAMLEGGGFEVIDLGVDVSPQKFIDAARANAADIVGLSALLTTTLPAMKSTVDALSSAGIRQQIKVIVGGAPVSRHYADSIGADGYAENAAGSVQLALQLIGAQSTIGA